MVSAGSGLHSSISDSLDRDGSTKLMTRAANGRHGSQVRTALLVVVELEVVVALELEVAVALEPEVRVAIGLAVALELALVVALELEVALELAVDVSKSDRISLKVTVAFFLNADGRLWCCGKFRILRGRRGKFSSPYLNFTKLQGIMQSDYKTGNDMAAGTRDPGCKTMRSHILGKATVGGVGRYSVSVPLPIMASVCKSAADWRSPRSAKDIHRHTQCLLFYIL